VETPPSRQPFRAVATWCLCASFVGIHGLVTYCFGPAVLKSFDFVPANPWRLGGLTFVTATFLHYGWLHVGSNVCMTLFSGVHVEHLIGRWRVLLVFVVAGAAGHVAHRLLDPRLFWHSGGASGGAYGLMTFYCLAYRRESIRSMATRLRRWLHLKTPAHRPNAFQRFRRSCLKRLGIPKGRLTVLHLLVAFVLFEAAGLARQRAGLTAVSSAAHLGGTLAGAACYCLWKRVKSTRPALVSRHP